MCEAMRTDPDRTASMDAVAACVDKPCGEFAACVKAATSKSKK